MRYKRSICISISLIIIFIFVSVITFYLSQGPCPRGSFSCDNETKCVLQRQICDQRYDCIDGFDEDQLECGLLHGSLEFIKKILMSNVTRLNATMINSCALTWHPNTKCECKHLTAMFCNHLNLTTIPKLTSGQATSLFLKNNQIQLINSSLDGYDLTVNLHLKNNNISSLPVAVFGKQKRLRKLFLDDNKIWMIKPGTFRNLVSLEWLILGANKFFEFPLVELKNLQKLQTINLSSNFLQFNNDEQFPYLANILELYLDDNHIVSVNDKLFSSLGHLQCLSMNYNKIKFIHPDAFLGLTNLTELRIAHNQITELLPTLFKPMINLDALFIGFNKFHMTENNFEFTNISLLNLNGIEFENINFNAIGNIFNLKAVSYKKFYYCPQTPHIQKCRPTTDGISTLNDLLAKPVLRYSTWIMATLALIGNGLVLWGRFACNDENRAVSMVIRNLAVADLFMGIYLIIIGTQDLRYREQYQEYSLDWIESWKCATTGVLAMISSEVSLLILAFMSVERFLLIADPFGGHRRLNTQNVLVILFTIWLFGITLAIVPIIHYRSTTRYYGLYSGTCFPLHLQEGFPIGWQYSAFVFLGMNMFLLILIATVYTALLISIWKTRKATPLAFFDFEFAIRFFFIVFTDAACWAPIMATKIFVFFSNEVSADTCAWLIVFVLPLNSAINPLLYTFTTPKYRNQVLMRGWNKFASRKEVLKVDGSGTSNQDDSQGKIIPILSSSSDTTFSGHGNDHLPIEFSISSANNVSSN